MRFRVSVAIAIKGKPAYVEAFGVADRDTGEALKPDAGAAACG
jgi:hypothetical protein